jgi:hypothetical protein
MKRIFLPVRQIVFAGALAAANPVGLLAASAPAAAQDSSQSKSGEKPGMNEVYGTIHEIKGARLSVETRTGKIVQVDATAAQQGHRCATLVVGHAIDAVGTMDKAGVLYAESIQHAKPSSAMWPPDR